MRRNFLRLLAIVGLLLISLLPPGVSSVMAGPGDAISVGYAPDTGNGSGYSLETTFISFTSACNGTGTINSVDIYETSGPTTGLIIGVFYTSSGGFTCRASQAVGNESGSGKHTYNVSLSAHAGDYIGCYYTSGGIRSKSTGGSLYGYISGNYISPGVEASYTTGGTGGLNLLISGSGQEPFAVPTVTTSAASGIGATYATLSGNINSTGGENSTIRGFRWGEHSGDYTDNWSEIGSFGTESFSDNVSGLFANKLYYYQAFAENSAGTGFSSESGFVTSSAIVSVSTLEAADVVRDLANKGQAILQGSVESLGGADSANLSFEYGLDTSYGYITPTQAITNTGNYSSAITGLMQAGVWHFRVRADAGGGMVYGNDATFSLSSMADIFFGFRETMIVIPSILFLALLASLGSFSWSTAKKGKLSVTLFTIALSALAVIMAMGLFYSFLESCYRLLVQ